MNLVKTCYILVKPAGRKEAILKARQEKKRLTLEHRKKYNLEGRKDGSNQHQGANSN